MKFLTTPWRDQMQMAQALNGIQSEATQVKSNVVGEPV